MSVLLKNSKLFKLAAIYEKEKNYEYKLFFDIEEEQLKELLIECSKNVKFYFCDEKLEKCNKFRKDDFLVIDHNVEKDIFFVFKDKGNGIKVFNKIGKILNVEDIISKIEKKDILAVLKWLGINYEIYKIIEKIDETNPLKISSYFSFLYSHIELHKIFKDQTVIKNFWESIINIEDKNFLFDIINRYFEDYISIIDESTHKWLISFLIKEKLINKIDKKILYNWILFLSENEKLYNNFIASLINEKNKIDKHVWDLAIQINNKQNKPNFTQAVEIKDGYNTLYKNIDQKEFFIFLKENDIIEIENLCLYNIIDCSENEIYNNIFVLFCPRSTSKYYFINIKKRMILDKDGKEINPEDILVYVNEPILSTLIKTLNLKKDYYYLKNIFDFELKNEYIKKLNKEK